MARQDGKLRTRARLIGVAREMFEELGYAQSTTRVLAQRAGVSTGAIFANFPDKASVYHAVYGHWPISVEQGRALLLAIRAADSAALQAQVEAIEHAAAKDRPMRPRAYRKA